MKPLIDIIKTELAVIGAGMAGMSAAFFARNRGLSTVQIGGTGELIYAAGPWDLLGVHPIEQKHIWNDPWRGIATLVQDLPDHPYAKISEAEIRAAFDELLEMFERTQSPYRRHPDQNCEIITSVGTLKTTYCVPAGMWQGVIALQRRRPCLLIDFPGMKDFSARQIAETLKAQWPDLSAVRIPVPTDSPSPELSTDALARALDLPEARANLARLIAPHLGSAQSVGMPAVLGLYRNAEAIADLSERLGVPVFEIPTPPISVPGLRLKETFEQHLRNNGVHALPGKRVLNVDNAEDGGFFLQIGRRAPEFTVHAQAVILASGRFFGKGLAADRTRIRETLFDLPVHQPPNRLGWHRKDMLDPRGHPIHQAGLEVDTRFRPLGTDGKPVHPTLFAAGSILAHQDWMRMKCGAGLAITTAYAAVNALDGRRSP